MSYDTNSRYLVAPVAVFAVLFGVLSCGSPSRENFFYGALGFGTHRLVVATNNASGSNVLLYDLNGTLIDVLWDGFATTDIAKGIAPFDAFNIAVSVDGTDRISRVNIVDRSTANLATSVQFTGTLYALAWDALGQRYYAVEGNTIESFKKDGSRVGAPYINTTVGGCTNSTARGTFATADGRLFVTNTGNHRLNVYDVTSASSSTCLTSNTNFGTNQPMAVLVHSNGLVYVATNANHQIYSLPNDGTGTPTLVWTANIAIIRNPTALLELPDGTILVASDLTNSIERITTNGSYVGGSPFIKDDFTGTVTQMMLMGGE